MNHSKVLSMYDAQKIFDFVDQLPQARHIAQDVRERWIERTIALGDHDPMWHARRLRGIGSSEIGCCVQSARGIFTPFQSARDVALSKLMVLAPDAGSGDTRRGNHLETVIRDMFHAKFGTRSETAMMEAMQDVVVSGAPWMVGNPDDLCVIDGTLYIVDYKAPRPTTLEENQKADGVDFDYVCQLHHLQRIGREAGLQIKGRLLCALDYNNWDLDVRAVPFDGRLLEEMMQVGNELWNEFVLKGDAPVMPRMPEFADLKKDDEQTLNALAQRFVIAKTMNIKTLEQMEVIQKEIAGVASKYQLLDAKMKLRGGSVKAKMTLDEPLMAALCQRHGIEFKNANKADLEETMNALERAGESRMRYIVEVPSFRISQSTKGADAELIQLCKDESEEALKAFAATMTAKIQARTEEADEAETSALTEAVKTKTVKTTSVV